VWSSRFGSSTRTGVRKALRQGVTVECDPSGRLVPELYQLMQQAVARWARCQHGPLWLARLRLGHRDPCKKFEAIARLLGARCRLWLARVEGRPAGAFVILQGVNAYGFRAAMDEELKGYHPTTSSCDSQWRCMRGRLPVPLHGRIRVVGFAGDIQ
jgi:hypothetical protein